MTGTIHTNTAPPCIKGYTVQSPYSNACGNVLFIHTGMLAADKKSHVFACTKPRPIKHPIALRYASSSTPYYFARIPFFATGDDKTEANRAIISRSMIFGESTIAYFYPAILPACPRRQTVHLPRPPLLPCKPSIPRRVTQRRGRVSLSHASVATAHHLGRPPTRPGLHVCKNTFSPLKPITQTYSEPYIHQQLAYVTSIFYCMPSKFPRKTHHPPFSSNLCALTLPNCSPSHHLP